MSLTDLLHFKDGNMAGLWRLLGIVCMLLGIVHPLGATTLTFTIQQGVSLQTSNATLVCVRSTTSGWVQASAKIELFRKRRNETSFAKIVESRFPPSSVINPTPTWVDCELRSRASIKVEYTPLPKGTLTVNGVSCSDEAYYYCSITATSNNQSLNIKLSDVRCAGYVFGPSFWILIGLVVAFFIIIQNQMDLS